MGHECAMLFRWGAPACAAWPRYAPASGDDALAHVAQIGPPVAAPPECGEVIASWEATTPPATWVEVQLRARVAGRWSRFYRVAAWDTAARSSRRHSFAAQRDADAALATDTLRLATPTTAVQARVLLCAEEGAAPLPALTSLALCLTGPPAPAPSAPPSAHGVARLPLEGLPRFSQYAYAGGGDLCSPTALAMTLGYWCARTADPRLAPFCDPASVPDRVAPMVYDPVFGGAGNWAFNTAFAATLGLEAFVTRLCCLEQLARWTAAGAPVIASLAWQPGDLVNAPIPQSAGHLTVVVGVEGDTVLVADPAGADAGQVLRAYPAAQFVRCWQDHSAGAVYLIYPPGWPVPQPGPGDAW